MLSRVVYKKQRGRRLLTALATLTLVTGTFVVGNAVLAVNNTGAFEIKDGNPTDEAAAGDDWENICHQVTITNDPTNLIPDQCASAAGAPNAKAISWIDAQGSADIFTGGGSKDPQDIEPSWLWKPKDTVPDKDTLVHGYAARYSLPPDTVNCPAGSFPTCEVIFFGSDRFDNSGDSQQGFWFFQNKIELTNTASQGGFKFSGVHKNGDLLVISQFSNGGSVSTIFVYFWDPSCTKAANNDPQPGQCGAANLLLKARSATANCGTSPANAGFCGIVNTTNGTTTPWSFVDKTTISPTHPANTYLAGEFYEGGINLSTLGIANECFASVASETRASTSPTATLKDFVLGNFGKCETTVVTTPKDGTGGTIPALGLSIGTGGSVDVTDSALLTVTGSASFTGTLDFHLCKVTTGNCASGGTAINLDPLAGTPPGSNTVTANGTYLSAVAHVTSAANDTTGAPGHYCWRANFTSGTTGVPNAADPKPTGDTTTTECFVVNPVTPTISTTATTTVVLGNPIDDTATLSGTANQPGTPVINPTAAGGAAGGTITFTLYGPSDTAVCTAANLLATSVVNVSGDTSATTVYKASNGTITGLTDLTPTAVGSYWWIAAYSGNDPNTLSRTTACGDTGEKTTVTGVASLATAQRWLPNDTAHVTSTAGTTLAGTVTFTLYNDGTCGIHALVPAGGTAQYGPVTKNVVTDANAGGTANSRFVSTTNGGATPFVVTTANDAVAWSWWVTYDDTTLQDPAGVCESTTPAFTLSD